jgi:hypothetical protein
LDLDLERERDRDFDFLLDAGAGDLDLERDFDFAFVVGLTSTGAFASSCGGDTGTSSKSTFEEDIFAGKYAPNRELYGI